MWIVKLVNNLDISKTDYSQSYFPHKFHYKKDAERIVERLELLFKVKSTLHRV